ncbi:hypothetical protein BGZ96_012090 [Linnemannia gamsii]|uniref:Uncharacterized protein n=1 Tax=Linnemannia gamsii TaxID=64522 RepID=A0ABQ7JR12_9FUNG|nr:hypothetical protein BGZ96_012090 [Linnemannia gamsii]
MAYRNRGLNLKIVTGLFMYVGDGLRPKPMDCIIFFTTVASFIKLPGNLLNILNVLPQNMALRIAVEEVYWVFVSFAFTSYFVGLLYAMPVTTREGIFAVYQPETSVSGKTLRPIHVMIPSNTTKNILLAIGGLYPTVTGIGFGIISGVLYDRGNYDGSRIAMLLQYSNWVLIFWTLAVMFFYYGLKYTFILRANIIIAEAELKAPRSTFGIGNLASRSPARFLFVQLQITGFGGSAVTIVGGGGCLAWVIAQQKILSMDSIAIPLTGAFFWTTAMSAAFFVLLALVGAQTVRNRRRGLHQPSNGQSDGGHRSLPPHESLHKSSTGGPLGSTLSSMSRHTTSETEHDGYPLQLSRTNLGEDHSSLHTGISSEKYSMDQFRNHWEGTITEGDIEQGFHGEQETYRTPSLSPPPRPLMALPSSSVGGPLSNGQPDANRSQIRESVFGGRTPREDGGGRPSISSPPHSPTSGGFNLPRRTQGRNSGAVPRPSTSSANSQTSSTPRSVIMGTGPCPGVSVAARLKASNSPKKDIHSALISVTQSLPLAPVSSSPVQGPAAASRIASHPLLPPKQRSQPIPQARGPGPTDRKHSLGSDVGLSGATSVSAPNSVAIYVPPSRGPGGGYRTKPIDIDPPPL